jgi:hypothetical protein
MDDSKVAVLLEDIRSQFRVFGEGLQMLNEKVDGIDIKVGSVGSKVENLELEMKRQFRENSDEHKLILQMIRELNEEQLKIKRAK